MYVLPIVQRRIIHYGCIVYGKKLIYFENSIFAVLINHAKKWGECEDDCLEKKKKLVFSHDPDKPPCMSADGQLPFSFS